MLIVEISVDVHSARVKVGEKTRDLCWNMIVVYEGARRSSSLKRLITSTGDVMGVHGNLLTDGNPRFFIN